MGLKVLRGGRQTKVGMILKMVKMEPFSSFLQFQKLSGWRILRVGERFSKLGWGLTSILFEVFDEIRRLIKTHFESDLLDRGVGCSQVSLDLENCKTVDTLLGRCT